MKTNKIKHKLVSAKLYSRLLQAQLAEKTTNKPSDDPESSSSTQQIVDKKEPEFKEKVEDYLHGPEVVQAIEDKITPYFQKEVDSFIQRHQDKVFVYATNQEELIKDVTEDFPVLKYLKWASYVLDAAFVALTVKNIAQTVFTLGAGAVEAIPEEAAAYAGKQVVQQFIKTSLKEILIKIATKLISKQILAAGAMKVGKAFAAQALRQVGLMSFYNAMASTLTETSLSTLKNILIEKGTSEYGLPKEFVTQFVKPDTTLDTAKNIAESFYKKEIEGLKQMFATQPGLEHLAFNTALSMIWGLKGRLNIAAFQGISKLDQLTSQVRGIQQGKKDSTESILTDDQINEMLKKSQIPKNLYSNYITYLKQSVKTEKDAQTKIHTIDIAISSIMDSLYELVMIDLVRENKDYFLKNKDKLNSFIAKITDVNNMSLEDLLQRSETNSPDQALQDLYQQKLLEINELLVKVGLSSNPEKINALRKYFMDWLNLKQYKAKLQKETFGDSSPKTPKK